MPGASTSRWVVRAAVLVISVGVASGVLAVGRGDAPTQFAAPAVRATTSTTAAPALPPPATTPSTTEAPVPIAPPSTLPPTTAAPRPVAAAAPLYAAQTAQERGEAALALINYPWQRLGVTLEFLGPRAGLLGLTNSVTRVISIYVRDNESLDTLARTIAHEMGHALDFAFLSVAEARQYVAIRGIDATPATWFGCSECSDYQTAAGDFAETFQYWLLGDGEFRSEMGPKPSAEQLAQLAAIFTI